jgi:5'-deoxynucleotidase YfbR-like HD superfamily hydrolase
VKTKEEKARQKKIEDAWILTYTGKKFNPFNPNPYSICIEDIAHSLSMLCRFTGHSSFFYSVAQHSVYVSKNCDDCDSLYGLMHDATEAFMQDIPSPLKRSGIFDEYKVYEKILQDMIYEKFAATGYQLNDGKILEPESVKNADLRMLATEARDLLLPHQEWNIPYIPYNFKIEPMNPKEAKQFFMDRYIELTDHEDFPNYSD